MRTCKCGNVCPNEERLKVHKNICSVLLKEDIATLLALCHRAYEWSDVRLDEEFRTQFENYLLAHKEENKS